MLEKNLQTNPSGEIEAGECTCIAGTDGNCKHSAALVFYVNTYEDESPTSEKCRWNIPKRVQDYSKGCIVKDLFVRRQNGTGLQPAPPEEILKHFPDIECPLANLLKVRSSLQENIAGNFNLLVMLCSEFSNSCNGFLHFCSFHRSSATSGLFASRRL